MSEATLVPAPVPPPVKVKPLEYKCRVVEKRWLTPTVFELVFTADKPFPFKGGQFISIIIPGRGPGGRDLRRAYSIASEPGPERVELCVKLVEGGPGTTYLRDLQVGDEFRGMSPYGDFTCKTGPGRVACFISTGTGIAPFRSMLRSAEYRAAPPDHSILLLGVRGEAELLYDAELRATAGLEWVTCVSWPSDAWKGNRGRVTDWLRARPAEFAWAKTDFYLCGNGEMIAEVKAILAERGVDKSAIHQEKYY